MLRLKSQGFKRSGSLSLLLSLKQLGVLTLAYGWLQKEMKAPGFQRAPQGPVSSAPAPRVAWHASN